MNTVTIWSDIGCPWSYVACLRLHRVRDHLDVDVDFDFRARPLELSSGSPSDRRETWASMAVLAQHEHTAFSRIESRIWPTTLLPAFEAQRWGYQLGQDIGERFDLALRRGFFLHGHNISMRNELLEIARSEGLDVASLRTALDTGVHRKDVITDFDQSQDLATDGTPVIVLPDGTEHHNPGMTVEWVRGIPLVISDHPAVYEDIIRAAAAS